MRSIAAIVFLAAATAWADKSSLTWEPARIVHAEEVVASGILAPTDPHPAFFDSFSDAVLGEDGSVAFIANGANRGVSSLGREGIYAIDRHGRASIVIQKGDIFGDEAASVASVVALELRNGAPVARCLLEDGRKKTFVLPSDRLHRGGGTVADARGDSPVIIKYKETIYWSASGGAKQIVADLTTRIPDLFEGAFTGFDDRIVAFGPWVVFSGSAKDYAGLFAMNMKTARLFLLLDNRALLGGRRVEDFQISKAPRSGEDLAVTVTFADGGSGIYIFRFGDGQDNPLFGARS